MIGTEHTYLAHSIVIMRAQYIKLLQFITIEISMSIYLLSVVHELKHTEYLLNM